MKKIFILLFSVGFLLTGCGGASDVSSSKQDKNVSESAPRQYEIVSEKTQETESLTVTFKSIKALTDKKDIKHIEEIDMFSDYGPEYLVIDYEMKNKTENTFTISDTYLRLNQNKDYLDNSTFFGSAIYMKLEDPYEGKQLKFDEETSIMVKGYIGPNQTFKGQIVVAANYEHFNFQNPKEFYIGFDIADYYTGGIDSYLEFKTLYWKVEVN